MNSLLETAYNINRRSFFGKPSTGIGTAALASLLGNELQSAEKPSAKPTGGLTGFPNFAPKAKRVIYLFQSGAPSQMDLYDYKPKLAQKRKTELPDSIRRGQR